MSDHSICVCISRNDSLVSRFIRFWSRGRVSHALITFRSQTLGKVFAMESTATGWRLTPWSYWRKKNTLVARYRLTIPVADQLRALSEMSDYLGTKYDYKGLLGFFWRWLRGRMSNRYHSAKKLLCSEGAAMFLLKAGLETYESPETWTPHDLDKEWQKDANLELVEPLPEVSSSR